MSSITLRDLPRTTELDQRAMSAVRGGHSWGGDVQRQPERQPEPVQVQDVDLNVLNNNGSIGAGFTGPTVNLAATQTGFNNAVIPKLF